jgi:DTW domain-containing protein YfiP
MSQRLAGLRGLRKWALPAPAGRRSLRAAPAGGMSTLEALAEALAVLEGEAAASQLRAAHQEMLDKQLADRGYVGPMR